MDLNACKRCGGTAEQGSTSFDDVDGFTQNRYSVRCVDCGLTTDLHPTEEEAVGAWNDLNGTD